MTTETDRYFIERCLDGHREDFRHLVARYQKALLAGIRVRQVRLDVAEEAAQEAFVRAFANLAGLRKPESFFAWLLGIAYHVLQEIRDRERRDREMSTRLAFEPRADSSEIARESDDETLEAAIADLPDPYREVILLRFYGDCSCAEVSERLNIPLGTVTKRLSRAYEELRRRLAVVKQERGDYELR
jgi:RNA polymerase sigma-70 factor (ECF subfamily)